MFFLHLKSIGDKCSGVRVARVRRFVSVSGLNTRNATRRVARRAYSAPNDRQTRPHHKNWYPNEIPNSHLLQLCNITFSTFRTNADRKQRFYCETDAIASPLYILFCCVGEVSVNGNVAHSMPFIHTSSHITSTLSIFRVVAFTVDE